MIEEISWGRGQKQDQSPGRIDYPHPDYEKNMQDARTFMKNMKKRLPTGMRMSIAGSHDIPNAIFWITWHPPIGVNLGSYARPIMIHQGNASFRHEVATVFNGTASFALFKMDEFGFKYGFGEEDPLERKSKEEVQEINRQNDDESYASFTF